MHHQIQELNTAAYPRDAVRRVAVCSPNIPLHCCVWVVMYGLAN
jgi:hypothetical protein